MTARVMTPRVLTAPETLGLLPTSGELVADLPASPGLGIDAHREAVRRVLDGEDDRVLAVVGPCSIHDPVAGPGSTRADWPPPPRGGRATCS